MNGKILSLALAAFSFVSVAAANADCLENRAVVLPAVLDAPACTTSLGSGYYNGLNIRTESAVLGDACATTTYSAVIPTQAVRLGAARGLCGSQVGNSLFDASIFGFGLRFGTVNPNWDMRPAGDY